MRRKMLEPSVIDRSVFPKEDNDLLDRFSSRLLYHENLYDSWIHGGNRFNKEREKEVENNWKQLQIEEIKAWSVIDKYQNVMLINGNPLESIYIKP